AENGEGGVGDVGWGVRVRRRGDRGARPEHRPACPRCATASRKRRGSAAHRPMLSTASSRWLTNIRGSKTSCSIGPRACHRKNSRSNSPGSPRTSCPRSSARKLPRVRSHQGGGRGITKTMKDNVKRVFYVRYVAHPCYLDIIAQRPEIRLDKLENESSDDVAEVIMAAAHAYQIGSSRDELNPRFYARRELLARMSNLLVVSTNGAGFDTVNV